MRNRGGAVTLSSRPDETLRSRSAAEVFEDHLRLRMAGDLETDLRRNYADEVVLLTVNSCFIGHDGMRRSAKKLADQLPDAKFEFIAKKVEQRFALVIWRAESSRFEAVEGSDSFVIEDGLIRLQTIHYGLRPSS